MGLAIDSEDVSSIPALWPAECPGCKYPWQGLTLPRCPECGEQVQAGEIVLVGYNPRSRANITGENTGEELLVVFFAAGVCVLISFFFGDRSPEMMIVSFVIALVLVALVWLAGRVRRRRGIPMGVVRLSPEGFRVGAGETISAVRPWSRYRVKIYRSNQIFKLRFIRMWGTLPITDSVVILLELPIVAENAVLAHMDFWSKGRTSMHTLRGRLAR